MTSHAASGQPTAGARARLSRRAWGVLALSMTFWMADGYDTFVLLVTGSPSLHELLPESSVSQIPAYLGYLMALTLAGWATGGVLGGVLGDRLGRRRTMIYS